MRIFINLGSCQISVSMKNNIEIKFKAYIGWHQTESSKIECFNGWLGPNARQFGAECSTVYIIYIERDMERINSL